MEFKSLGEIHDLIVAKMEAGEDEYPEWVSWQSDDSNHVENMDWLEKNLHRSKLGAKEQIEFAWEIADAFELLYPSMSAHTLCQSLGKEFEYTHEAVMYAIENGWWYRHGLGWEEPEGE